ncbi:hypothetical protein [Bradyrhizobium sp. USDA 4508]
MAITLEQRRLLAGIIARMALDCVRAVHSDPNTSVVASVATVLPVALALLAVRENDVYGTSPISAYRIAREARLSETSVNRYIEDMIAKGVVERTDDGITGTDTYFLQQLDAPRVWDTVRAIIRAGRELEAMGLAQELEAMGLGL